MSFPARRWVVGVVACGLLLTGCSHNVMDGRAVSMLFDPDRVGGLPATDGLSGPRAGMPPLAGTVDNTNNGDLDRLALLAVNDIEDYWKRNYSDALPGSFTAVSGLLSYDSNDPSSPAVLCGETYGLINAFYCPNLVRTRRLRSQTRQDRHPHSMKPTPEPHPAATPPTIIAATKAFSGRSS